MITYTDSRAATTSFVVMLCVRSRGRTCTGYARIEAFRHVDIEGVNHIPFNARLHGRPLPAGTYRLTATPMAGRKKGSTVSATFRILG